LSPHHSAAGGPAFACADEKNRGCARLRPRDWTGWVSIRDEQGNQVDSVPVIAPGGT